MAHSGVSPTTPFSWRQVSLYRPDRPVYGEEAGLELTEITCLCFSFSTGTKDVQHHSPPAWLQFLTFPIPSKAAVTVCITQCTDGSVDRIKLAAAATHPRQLLPDPAWFREWPMAPGLHMAPSFPLTLVDVFHQVAVPLGVSPNDLVLLINDNAHLLQTF